jgi:four helix bundle protein
MHHADDASRGPRPPGVFDHEKLHAYSVATEALADAVIMSRRVPPEDRFLRSQLLRSITSVCFNVAEASGEFSAGDKVRFFRMSRRSACEAAAIVDALRILGYVKPDAAIQLKHLLHRITAMLTRLIQSRIPNQ